jgi:hypothetical protein
MLEVAVSSCLLLKSGSVFNIIQILANFYANKSELIVSQFFFDFKLQINNTFVAVEQQFPIL